MKKQLSLISGAVVFYMLGNNSAEDTHIFETKY